MLLKSKLQRSPTLKSSPFLCSTTKTTDVFILSKIKSIPIDWQSHRGDAQSGEVRKIPATSQHPLFHKRNVRITDDDMVEELDAEQFSGFLEPAGDLDVLPARCGVQ